MRKNILLFGHSYATQFIDISNQYTKLFDPSKYEVTVAYLVGKPDEAIRQKHCAEHVIFLNSPKRSVRGLKIHAIRHILKLCREKRFEIVVCQRYKPSYVMLWVARFCRIPALLFVMHELGTITHIARKIQIKLLAQENMIFAGVSDAVRDDLRHHLWGIPPERIITLHNMIDVEFTEKNLFDRATARKKLNLPQDAFVFGNIGRLAINKDQKTLIQAFASIKSSCPHAKLVIVGDGQLEQDLKEQVAASYLTNDIYFTGFVPDSYRYIKAFDVLISASIQEAFGRVLLEAMIAKTPIIATAVNGVPEVIGVAGPLIPAGEYSLLATEMLKAYQASTDDLIRWGQKGYDRAINHFSLDCFNQIFWNLPLIQEREHA